MTTANKARHGSAAGLARRALVGSRASRAWLPAPLPAELIRLVVLLALAILAIGVVLPTLFELAGQARLA